MKLLKLSIICAALTSLASAESNPGWLQSFQRDGTAAGEYLEQVPGRTGGSAPGSREAAVPSAPLSMNEASRSLGEAEPSLAPQGFAPLSSMGMLGNEADAITPEIQALADGLWGDPLKIIEYVHNFIRYECYYGSKKGAHLTLLEGSGNDFDQAALLVALLRAAGESPTYEFGPHAFSYDEFVDWWGLEETPYGYLNDAQMISEYGLSDTSPAGVALARKHLAVIEYSKNAGYFYVEPWDAGGGLYFYSIPLCAVEVTIGGSTRVISPAYKKHVEDPGIDLAAAAGYSRSTLLSSAGGTTGSPDYVTSLNENAIGANLTALTSNLLAAIRTNYDSNTVSGIVGGRRTLLRSFSSFGQVPQMFNDPFAEDWCPHGSGWTAIPSSYMSMLELKAGTYNYTAKAFTSTSYTQEITMPSLAGKKISLAFSGNTASLRLDEDLIGSSFSVSGTNVDVRLEAKHDHYQVIYEDTNGIREPSDFVVFGQGRNNRQHAASYLKGDTNAYAFSYSFGNPGKQLRERQEKLDAYRRAGVADNDWRVLSEGLNVMGLSYYQQVFDMNEIAGWVYAINPINHHLFGRASQEGSFYIDVGLQLSNFGSGDIDYDQSDRFGGLTTLFASAMEHGVLEQTQGSGQLAVSTVRMIQTANANGTRIYRATPSNWNTVKSQLQNYSTGSKNAIGALLTDPRDKALIPRDGLLTVNEWTGGGYAVEGPGKAIMRISDTFNGGYSATDVQFYNALLTALAYQADPAFELTGSSNFDIGYTPLTTAMEFSWDPIEMASGAYVLDKSDLTLGGGNDPLGLGLSRQYHSNRRFQDAGLGFGWTHGCDVYATERSAPDASLGSANTYQAAPFLVALIAAKDLHSDHANAKEWVTAALAVHWSLEQMRYKAVSFTMGPRSIQFIRMPDGSYIGPPGMKLSLSKNGSNQYVLSERHGDTMTFDSSTLRLLSVSNTSGATKSYAYSGTPGKLSTVTDHFGRTLAFSWSGDRIGSVSDGTGRSVSFGYTDGDLTSFTDPEGKVWTYQYDADHRMTSLKDPQARFIAENDYDSESRVIRQRSMGDAAREWTYLYTGFVNTEINPQGGITEYFHDHRGRSIGVADPLGNSDYREYDGQDRTVLNSTPKNEDTTRIYNANNDIVEETDPRGETVGFFYDAQLRLQRISDRRGHDTTFAYTAAHLLETATDPLGHETGHTYHANGQLHTVTDAENKTITTTYDAWGNVNKITRHDGTFETFVNNARGDVLTNTDAENRTTTNTWNNRRQLLTTTAPAIPGQAAAVVENTYDDSGNLESTEDTNDNVTSYTWNALGKPVTSTLPALPAGNNVVTTAYDTRDWIERTTNSLGHIMRREHDPAHRMTALIDPLNRRSETTFDDNGRPLESEDPLNRVTESVWTARGEMEQAIDGEGAASGYGFDENGNLVTLVNRRGKTYTQVYDDADRLTSSTTPTGKVTAMTYFDNGLIETIEEPSGQTTVFGYNGKNLVSSKADPTATVIYGYDDSGFLETVTEGAAVISRSYDERGKVKTYTNADGDQLQYRYDGEGNLTRLIYPPDAQHPAGKQVTYTYNARNFLETVTDWNNRVTTYHYDRLGRLVGVTRPNGTSAAVQRDAGDQITGIRETANGKLISYLRFDHDPAGQIESRFRAPLVRSNFVHPTFAGTYDDDNRLVSVNGQAVVQDPDSNMTSGPIREDSGGLTLTYNSRNQLTNADGLSYTYDAEGHRRTSTDASGTTRFTIDANANISRLLVKHAPDGSKTYYVYGLGLLYEVDEAENTKTHHYDQVGSTIARTDDSGKVVGRAEYSAYGLLAYQDGDMETPFLYNGQWGIQTDSNGLLNMRARYYSPYLMRFLNADPAGFSGGSNWFAYADGNPISTLDPFGLWGWRNSLSLALDFIPIVGSVKSVVEVVAGYDFVAGEDVNRGVAAAGVVAGLIPGGKAAVKGGSKLFSATIRSADEAAEIGEAIVKKGDGFVYKRTAI